MNYQPTYRRGVTTCSLAVVSLVFGILAWIMLPVIGAIVAIICGHLARGEIRRAEPGALTGDGMALVGLILGYVHLLCGVTAVMVVAGMVWLGFAGHWF